MKNILRIIIKGLVRFFYLIVFRVKKIDEKNIPKEGAFIMAANHVSNWDPAALVTCTKRKMNIMAKSSLFKNKFLNFVGRTFDAIPVNREKLGAETIKLAYKTIKNNEILAIFPEGTRRGLSKGGKIKTGAAYFALVTGVPVIPVGIKGEYKPFTKITLKYGEPLDFSKFQTKKPEKELLDKISNEIMENIIRLTNECP